MPKMKAPIDEIRFQNVMLKKPSPLRSAPESTTPTDPPGDAFDNRPPADYDGPSVDAVQRMIDENVKDEEGVADVEAIIADMPDGLAGKHDLTVSLEHTRARIESGSPAS